MASSIRVERKPTFLSSRQPEQVRLAGGELVDSKTILTGARANGISERTLRRTKTRLSVRAKLVGFGKQGKWQLVAPAV